MRLALIANPHASRFSGRQRDRVVATLAAGHKVEVLQTAHPGQATALAGQAVANNQWAIFIAILIQLNIVVGVFNLLPLPPMDGGYLAFVLWQVVTRREVDLRKVVPVAALIVGLLVMLTVGLVWLDITNPVPYPFR